MQFELYNEDVQRRLIALSSGSIRPTASPGPSRITSQGRKRTRRATSDSSSESEAGTSDVTDSEAGEMDQDGDGPTWGRRGALIDEDDVDWESGINEEYSDSDGVEETAYSRRPTKKLRVASPE